MSGMHFAPLSARLSLMRSEPATLQARERKPMQRRNASPTPELSPDKDAHPSDHDAGRRPHGTPDGG